MAKREAPSKQTSNPDQPSSNDSVTTDTCDLCGKSYGPGDVMQAMAPANEGGSVRRVHMRCFHERVILERAMSSAQRPKTPSI